MRRAKIINIHVSERDAGLLFATSPDLPGLLVAGESQDELLESVPAVIREMMAVTGKAVEVVPVEAEDHQVPEPWVVISDNRTAA